MSTSIDTVLVFYIPRLLQLLCITLVCLSVYLVLKLHRIQSVGEVSQIVQTSLLPPASSRCKRLNETHLQCLPNVFFIGASKCGTTSLVDYLDRLPGVYFVNRRIQPSDKHKEVHRFDRPGYEWASSSVEFYHELASCPPVTSETDPVIHYTPHYLFAPSVPYDLQRFLPAGSAVKFVLLLREPVARAQSSYWFKKSHLFNSRDSGSVEGFHAAVLNEIDQRKEYERCMLRQLGSPLPSADYVHSLLKLLRIDPSEHNTTGSIFEASHAWELRHLGASTVSVQKAVRQCFSSEFRSPSLGLRHVDKSIYLDQILRWQQAFPQSQFLIIPSRWLEERPKEVVRYLVRWINVTHAEVPQAMDRIDWSERKLQRPNQLQQEISEELTRQLQRFFAPYNAALESLLAKAT